MRSTLLGNKKYLLENYREYENTLSSGYDSQSHFVTPVNFYCTYSTRTPSRKVTSRDFKSISHRII